MRRVTVVVVSAMMLVGMSAGAASSRSLTARDDPNDTRHVPDIRTIWTDVASGGVYLRIRTWDHLGHHQASFAVLLDTKETNGFDRVIEISGGECVVEKMDEGGLGLPIGQRPARFPGVRDVVCRMPSGWFAIRRTVRFVVKSGFLGLPHYDRAPDHGHGRYIGL
jgi:hypothetical protein